MTEIARPPEQANALDPLAGETRQAHEILTHFGSRYIKRDGYSWLSASTVDYDPEHPLCDYNRTVWEAAPNRLSEPLGRLVLSGKHGVMPWNFNRDIVNPLQEAAPDLLELRKDYPIIFATDHHPDMVPVLAGFALNLASARHLSRTGRNKGYRQELYEQFGQTHLVATRGYVPVEIHVGPRQIPNIPAVRAAQLIMNTHFTFPINEKMIEAGLPRQFRKAYTKLFKDNFMSAMNAPSDPRSGLKPQGIIAVGATSNIDFTDSEGTSWRFTAPVIPATVNLIGESGCAVVGIESCFDGTGRPVLRPGKVVLPEDYTDSTLEDMMTSNAALRRDLGAPNVRYAGEPLAQPAFKEYREAQKTRLEAERRRRLAQP